MFRSSSLCFYGLDETKCFLCMESRKQRETFWGPDLGGEGSVQAYPAKNWSPHVVNWQARQGFQKASSMFTCLGIGLSRHNLDGRLNQSQGSLLFRIHATIPAVAAPEIVYKVRLPSP